MINPLLLAENHAGFLPTRGTFMLDFVFLAMFVIVVVLTVSIYLVRNKRLFRIHKRIQISTALVLLVTIVCFEVDVRFFSDWKEQAKSSAWYESGWVTRTLWIHLAFAVPTPFVWTYTIWMAIRKIPAEPGPCAYSPTHKRLGWISALMMYGTAVTGWIFYILAFVL